MYSDIPIQTDKILFLETEEAADYYIDEFYKHNVEFVIVTADKTYPKDEKVRERMWDLMMTNEQQQIIVLAKTSMTHLKDVKTSNVILLHDMIEGAIKYEGVDNEYLSNYRLTKTQIGFIIHCLLLLTKQMKYAVGSGKYPRNLYEVTKEGNNSSCELRWEGQLIYPTLTRKYSVEITKDWDEVKEYWLTTLWSDRDDISPMSSMSLNTPFILSTDMDIYDSYEPTFFVVRDGGKIIGVNSGHRTNNQIYRSRGLYVDERYRGMCIGKILLNATTEQARDEGCVGVWTVPREKSLKTYESVGYKKVSEWFDKYEGFLYGPNCVAYKELNA